MCELSLGGSEKISIGKMDMSKNAPGLSTWFCSPAQMFSPEINLMWICMKNKYGHKFMILFYFLKLY